MCKIWAKLVKIVDSIDTEILAVHFSGLVKSSVEKSENIKFTAGQFEELHDIVRKMIQREKNK